MDRRAFLKLTTLLGAQIGSSGWATQASARYVREPFIDVARRGALGDGLTDDRDAIQRAIDEAAERGGGTVHIPEGTFLIGGQLNVRGDRVTLRGEGRGSVIRVGSSVLDNLPGQRHALHVEGNDFRLSDLTVDGNLDEQIPQSNLDLIQLGAESTNGSNGLVEGERYRGFVISRCRLRGAVTHHIRANKCSSVVIRNNALSGVTDDPNLIVGNIKVRWVTDFIIEKNRCRLARVPRPLSTNIHVSHSGNSESGSARGIIRGNTVRGSTDSPIEASGSTSASALKAVVRDVVITDNLTRDGAGIISLQSRNIKIENNQIVHPGRHGGNAWGIRLGCSENSTPDVLQEDVYVRGNRIIGATTDGAPTRNGVVIDSCGGAVRQISVTDNHITDIGSTGSHGILVNGRDVPPPNELRDVYIAHNQMTRVNNPLLVTGTSDESVNGSE